MAPKARTAWSEGGTPRTPPAPTSAPPLHSGPWATAGRRTAPCLRSAGPASEATGGRCASHSDFGRDCGSGVFGLTPPSCGRSVPVCPPTAAALGSPAGASRPIPSGRHGGSAAGAAGLRPGGPACPSPSAAGASGVPRGRGWGASSAMQTQGPLVAGQRLHCRSGPQGVWSPPPPIGSGADWSSIPH